MEEVVKIHVGTSGWHYGHWVGPFYPADINKKDFLAYYSRFFHTVEINNSFYRLPEKKIFEQWRDTVPEDFFFAVKASRYITHMKRLKEPGPALDTFFERANGLGDKLGPVLFQLPPHFSLNIGRLKDFLEALPESYRYAFEFRDQSWFCAEVYRALKEHGAAFCTFELAGVQSPKEITAGFTYIRLHGPGAAYSGRYTTEALKEWANLLSGLSEQGIECYCYFDNDESGYAAQNALELQALVSSISQPE